MSKNSLPIKMIIRIILFIILTAITQIGGVVLILSEIWSNVWRWKHRLKPLILFAVIYGVATFMVVPLLAPLGGRTRVRHPCGIAPATWWTVLLNRNYVRPEMNNLLEAAQQQLQPAHISMRYLDANFPFWDKFPLWPHLSHNDGKKLDIGFVYETKEDNITDRQKSVSGYGVFEGPAADEPDQIQKCLDNGFYQYDIQKYLTFGKINSGLRFSPTGTKTLISALLKTPSLGKMFIEPHLKQRLNLTDSRVRYHGCQAVRHDDHIHIQLK